MSDIDVQMEGVVTPTYDKRRKGYKFKQDGMEIFIKGEDKDAAMKQMSELLESKKEEDNEVHSFAEGGMEDGGLKQEGGTVDPVSGNDVPVGSTQKEVRDDIPAQLSEGEFVFPADVVRYIGLENLMELRAKAKQGLAKMDAMGQMGNSEEATMEDDGEYDGEIDELIENFDPNDPSTMEFAEGGVVYAQQGAFMPGNAPPQQFSYGYGMGAGTGYTPPSTASTPLPSQSQFITSPARVAVGQAPVAPELRRYVGPNNEILMIPFYDGKPMKGYTIPAGYKYKPEEEAVAEAPEVAKPTVSQPSGGGDGPSREEQEAEADRLAFDAYETRAMVELEKSLGLGTKVADAWSKDPRSKLGPDASLYDHVVELAKAGGPIGAALAGINTTSAKSDFYDDLSGKLNISRDQAKELMKLEAIPQYVDKVTTGERDTVDVSIGGNNYTVSRGGGVVNGKTTLTPSEAARRSAVAATQISTSGGSDWSPSTTTSSWSQSEISAQQEVDDSPGYSGGNDGNGGSSSSSSSSSSGGMDQGSDEDVSGPE